MRPPPFAPPPGGQPLNFFHFDEQTKSGSPAWYDSGSQYGGGGYYGGNKDRRGVLFKLWSTLKSFPCPSPLVAAKVSVLLAVLVAVPYYGLRAWREYERKTDLGPKFTAYLNNGCRGESIAFTRADGYDMATKRLSGVGYEMCKFDFPGGINANDQIRSIRVERGVQLQLYEHCTGPIRTTVRQADGRMKTIGPHQPLSEGIEGTKYFAWCHDLKGPEIGTSFVQLMS